MTSPLAQPMPPTCLETAVQWYVQLNDSQVNDSQRQAWRAWLDASPDHARAWARVEKLQRQLRGVPVDLALPVLTQAGVERRLAMKSLLVLAAVGLAGASYQYSSLSADYASRTGQRRQVVLADGSRLDLNTDTQVDVHYGARERLITLRHGEISLHTAPDPQTQAPRPLVVKTRHGRIQALGTVFNVRLDEQQTRVSVQKHAVEVRNAHGIQRLDAGQALRFDALALGAVQADDPNSTAWTTGMLVVIDWRLGDFINELARYRPGHLSCAPEVANLQISGAFTLDDTDAVLANVTASLPVRVRRFSRYWLRLDPVV